MATLCRAYTSEEAAHAAVDRLLSARVPGADVQFIVGEAIHDSRDAPGGSFAGTTTTGGERVGSYGGIAHSSQASTGSYAGDADQQRRGGFGDIDRETVTTYSADVRRVRIASHHDLERLLIEAGLDEATAASDVEALHRGRVLVLVQSETASADLAAVMDA
jgi:hypothetical protein